MMGYRWQCSILVEHNFVMAKQLSAQRSGWYGAEVSMNRENKQTQQINKQTKIITQSYLKWAIHSIYTWNESKSFLIYFYIQSVTKQTVWVEERKRERRRVKEWEWKRMKMVISCGAWRAHHQCELWIDDNNDEYHNMAMWMRQQVTRTPPLNQNYSNARSLNTGETRL